MRRALVDTPLYSHLQECSRHWVPGRTPSLLAKPDRPKTRPRCEADGAGLEKRCAAGHPPTGPAAAAAPGARFAEPTPGLRACSCGPLVRQARNAEARGSEDPGDAGELLAGAAAGRASPCARPPRAPARTTHGAQTNRWLRPGLAAGHRLPGSRQDHPSQPHPAAKGQQAGGGD